MGELHVRANEQRVVLLEGDRLGFGRVNADTGGVKGWGYDGRFMELSPKSHVHRIWAEIVWSSGLWRVRSLGSMHPVVVEVEGQRPIQLAPASDGAPPAEFAVTQDAFDLVFSVAADSFRVSCREVGPRPAAHVPGPGEGAHTATLCDEMSKRITATEFQVLWLMASDYRSDPPSSAPQPLSYSRICRALGLTDRQAVSAVSRAVSRFRAAGLMPDTVPAEDQRDWMCRQLVIHRVFEELALRYGEPTVA